MTGKKPADLGQHQAIKDLLEMKNGGMNQKEFEKKHGAYIGEVPSWDSGRSGGRSVPDRKGVM